MPEKRVQFISRSFSTYYRKIILTKYQAVIVKSKHVSIKVDIIPVSNPDIFSTSQRIAMAQEMMQLVQSNPEIHGATGICIYRNVRSYWC